MRTGNILEGVRTYILKCPFLKDGHVNVNYMGVEMGYSIEMLPCEPIIKEYVDGSQVRQFRFAFTSIEAFGGDVIAGLESCGFLQDFEEWVEENNHKGILPDLGDEGMLAEKVEVATSGYLMDVDKNNGRYQIQLNLKYFKEASKV